MDDAVGKVVPSLEGLVITSVRAGHPKDLSRIAPVGLSPMLVQYLVALCCMRWDPSAVDILIGDMVFDSAARKPRDVDVTVTIKQPDGSLRAFKAYEVKDESSPLGVEEAEQLCLKLGDMPEATHKAIVSASGFSDGARNKAEKHGVQLYWMRRLNELPRGRLKIVDVLGGLEGSQFEEIQLFWKDVRPHLIAPTGPPAFTWQLGDSVLSRKGVRHKRFRTIGDFIDEALYLSAEARLSDSMNDKERFGHFVVNGVDANGGILVGEGWPAEDQVAMDHYEAYLVIRGALHRIDRTALSGMLQWQKIRTTPWFYTIEDVFSGELLAAAAVMNGARPGVMHALTADPESLGIGINLVRLQEKHWNRIRNLSVWSQNNP